MESQHHISQEGFTSTWGQRSILGSAVADNKDPDFNFSGKEEEDSQKEEMGNSTGKMHVV